MELDALLIADKLEERKTWGPFPRKKKPSINIPYFHLPSHVFLAISIRIRQHTASDLFFLNLVCFQRESGVMKACISHWQEACFCAKKRVLMLSSFCL